MIYSRRRWRYLRRHYQLFANPKRLKRLPATRRAAKFFQGPKRLFLGKPARVHGQRARLAIGKPKVAHLTSVTGAAPPANLRAARVGIKKHRHLVAAAIMRLA